MVVQGDLTSVVSCLVWVGHQGIRCMDRWYAIRPTPTHTALSISPMVLCVAGVMCVVWWCSFVSFDSRVDLCVISTIRLW